MERILVTGGSGFIGTNLIAALRAEGNPHIVNFDIEPPRHPEHEDLWVRGDLLDAAQIGNVIADLRPTHIYHLGARTDLHGSTLQDYGANVEGTLNVVKSVNTLGEQVNAIYASSRLVHRVGHQPTSDTDYAPPNAYGASKVCSERIVRELAQHRHVIVRPTSIWGPWFGVPYRDFFDAVRAGLFLSIQGVEIPKSFGFVGNTVHQLRRLMSSLADVNGQTLYLADYRPMEVNAFAAAIREAFGKPPSRQVPVSLLRVLARVGDLAKRLGWREAKLTSFRLQNMLTPMVYDLTPLERVVGPLPYSEREGIEATVAWMSAGDNRHR